MLYLPPLGVSIRRLEPPTVIWNSAYYFTTDEGTDYKVTLKGINKVEVSFYARGDNNQEKDNITGTGDSLKVFGTVINIVKFGVIIKF